MQELKRSFFHGTTPFNEHLAGGYITNLGEIPAPFVTSSLISRTVCLQQTISEMRSRFVKKKETSENFPDRLETQIIAVKHHSEKWDPKNCAETFLFT